MWYVCPRYELSCVPTDALQVKFSMSGEEITETLRAEDTTFPNELVAAGVEVS